MAQSTTLADLKKYARRINNDGESQKNEDQILAAIQDAMRNASQTCDWTFLRERKRITTREKYTTGRVNVTRNTATVIGVSNSSGSQALFPTSIESSNSTFDIKMAGELIDYPISARLGSHSLTLASVYVGTGSLTQASFIIFRRSYDLPANCREVLNIVDVRDPNRGIRRINHKEMLEYSLRRADGSTPDFYSIENKTGDAVRQLWLYPFPDGDTRLQYDLIYQRWPTNPTLDTDVIDWPNDLMPLLKQAIAVELALEQQDGERYDLAKTEYADKLREAMKGDVDESADFYIGDHSSSGSDSGPGGRRRGFQNYTVSDLSS